MLIPAHSAKIVTGAIAIALFVISRSTTAELGPVTTGIQFATLPIGAPEKPNDRRVRDVNPRLETIRGWISAVGAGVALGDLDGDGLANDICLVEPRDDSVAVFPAPTTGDRFQPIRLSPPTDGFRKQTVAPMGCLPGDFNEDGQTDLLVYYWGRPPVIHYREAGGGGRLAFRAVPLLAAREPWFTNAAIQADIDGDGHVDLLFGNYFPESAAVLDTSSADGGTMQKSMSRAFNGGRNRLFLRDAKAGLASGYTDHSSALTQMMSTGWTLALAASDLNGDLLPEIYVANDFGPDRMLVNLSTPGEPKFRLAAGKRQLLAPRSRTIGRDSFKGMGAEFADLTGDGLLDLAVSNIAQEYSLLESHFLFVNAGRADRLAAGTADFSDESGRRGTARNGWGWDIKAADFDNDGRPELLQALGFMEGKIDRWPELQELAMANDDLISNPSVWAAFRGDADLSGHQGYILYSQDSAGLFHNATRSARLRSAGVWRGIAIGDVDGDGRLDAALARQWGRSVLLLNKSERPGRYLSLDLRLANANGTSRPAIGAIARIERPGSPSLIGLVDGGNGHSGKRSPLIHFGLGRDERPVTVRLEWREDGRVHRSTASLAPGHHQLILGSSQQ